MTSKSWHWHNRRPSRSKPRPSFWADSLRPLAGDTDVAGSTYVIFDGDKDRYAYAFMRRLHQPSLAGIGGQATVGRPTAKSPKN